ncbi:hypothetical protein M5689_000214 [Euphorbia peplus]|nr:hypothetical protein M5689_000214 [Euphorbia peplus]
MKCQRKILLDQLTKDEERSLIEKIKNSTLEESVKFAAYKNIEKCRRFPGAFQAGRLVDCEKEYQSTLLKSMSFEPTRIFYDISTIWSKFSEEHKRCMLLCCLYAPVDEEISVEELGRYAYALGMYGSTIEHTMERLMMAIDNFSDYHFVFPSTRSERKIRLHVGARDYALLYEGNTNSFEF